MRNLNSNAISKKTTEILVSYGNVPGKRHIQAIEYMSDAYSDMIDNPNKKARIAIAADPGIGKTSSIAALVACTMTTHPTISLGICAEQVEALVALMREMIKIGVHRNDIGLYHQKREASKRSNTKGEVRQRRIALVCHNRIYSNASRGKLEEFYYKYKLNKRSLFIWDESLIKTDGAGLKKVNLLSALGGLMPVVEQLTKDKMSANPLMMKNNPYSLLLEHLRDCEQLIRSLDYSDGKHIDWLSTSTLSKGADRNILWDTFESIGTKSLGNLASINKATVSKLLSITLQDKATAYPSNISGEAILVYNTVVPTCLDRIVILDASSNIRKLVERDESILCTECQRKDYSSVSLHYWRSGGGRSTIEKNLASPHSTIDKEVTTIVKNIPENERILILTYKSNKNGRHDIKSKLSSTMRESNVNLNKIDWLTWGKHTNLNNYADIKNVIVVGILRRDRDDLLAVSYGQNAEAGLPSNICEIEHSELAHMLYQGAMRGHARHTINDKAGNMNIWVFDNAITEILSIFHTHNINFQLKEYTPAFMKRSGNASEAGREWIRNTLLTHGKDIRVSQGDKISTKKLKKLYPPPKHVSPSLLSKLFGEIGRVQLPKFGEWRFQNRSLVWINY